jgi:hypothetical protein
MSISENDNWMICRFRSSSESQDFDSFKGVKGDLKVPPCRQEIIQDHGLKSGASVALFTQHTWKDAKTM